MSRDIVDAAVMQKFKEYLEKKGFVKTSSEVRVRRDTKRYEQQEKLTMKEEKAAKWRAVQNNAKSGVLMSCFCEI